VRHSCLARCDQLSDRAIGRGRSRTAFRHHRGGAAVTLYGEGIYAADSWLIGVGNRGQDIAILLIEVPFLLVALRWYRRGGPVAAAVLTGVLAFFTYYYIS
jgi:hypothetical protein